MKGKLHLIIFRADLGGHFFYRRVARTPNSTYKKLAVQWLNKALCFVSSFVVADSFRLRNRQLLVAAKRCASCYGGSANLKLTSKNYTFENLKTGKLKTE